MNETYFEQLLQWLARCPALTGIDLRVDDLPPAAGTGALFPKGVEQTDRWQNLLGQVTARQKMQLVLRLNLPFVPGGCESECPDRPPPVGTAGLGGGAERGRLCPAAWQR